MQDTTVTLKNAPMLIRFEPSLKERLVERATKEGMSASAIIRMAVRAYLDAPKNGRKR